jgi:hypothetical protein
VHQHDGGGGECELDVDRVGGVAGGA